MFRRIGLFLMLNLLVVGAVSFFLHLFHVGPYLNAYGIDYPALMAFCLIWGLVGSFISLFLSKTIAKMVMRLQMISNKRDPSHIESMLLGMVEQLAGRAGLPEIPEVGIFISREPNAFATGRSKRNSLVAVSSGLLENLSKEEIEAVLAHEISHIANGDMVTMTLLQGVVNAFVMFLSRVLAFFLSFNKKERGQTSSSGMNYFFLTFIFEIVFMIFGSLLTAYFSRVREFRADRGSAELCNKASMIAALEKLRLLSAKETLYKDAAETSNTAIAALMIKMPSKKRFGLLRLFASHPSIEARITALRQL